MSSALRLAPLLLVSLLPLACRTSVADEESVPVTAAASKGTAQEAPAAARGSYVLAFLVTGSSGSELPQAERDSIQSAHLANIRRLADEGKLVVAGPFGQPTPDANLRGIFVFDTPDVATARTWTNSDPAVQAGLLAMELVPFASASPLRRAVELDRAETADLEKSGAVDDLRQRIRGYVMLLAREPARAERALAGLRGERAIVFEGELDGSPRGAFLAVLDAASVDEATEQLAPASADLGAHDLASWWAMKSLAALAAEAPPSSR